MDHAIISEKETFGIRGHVTLKTYPAGTLERIQPIADEIQSLRKIGRKVDASYLYKQLQQQLESKLIKIESDEDNLIMLGSLTGKDLLVQYLLGITIYTGINYGAIGTSATTPATTDTQLGSESARITPSLTNDNSFGEADFGFFFPNALLSNATYTEFGMFMNATATANSGKIFNHALFSPAYVKGSNVDTTVDCNIVLT